jgi:hypothetical protein
MIRTPQLERQQLEQLINTRPVGEDGGGVLGYDPTAAPDDDTATSLPHRTNSTTRTLISVRTAISRPVPATPITSATTFTGRDL